MKPIKLKTKNERLMGQAIGDKYFLSNGHWLVDAENVVIDDKEISSRVLRKESFTAQYGGIDEGCPDFTTIFPRECQPIKKTPLLLEMDNPREVARLLVAQNGETVGINDKYFDLFPDDLVSVAGYADNKAVMFFKHTGEFYGLCMPMHIDNPYKHIYQGGNQ